MESNLVKIGCLKEEGEGVFPNAPPPKKKEKKRKKGFGAAALSRMLLITTQDKKSPQESVKSPTKPNKHAD